MFSKNQARDSKNTKIFSDNLGSELRIPNLMEANLPIWEFCHVGWFYERWIVRNTRCSFDKRYDLSVDWDNFCSSRTHFKDADSIFDSSKLEHDARWDCKLHILRDARLPGKNKGCCNRKIEKIRLKQ